MLNGARVLTIAATIAASALVVGSGNRVTVCADG
jgi:hypothetical protein